MVRSVLLVLLLLALPLEAITQLSASVDKNPVLQGEAVTLEVRADGRLAADAINFSVLEHDFTVMVPSINFSKQDFNGQVSQSTSWKVVLLAKQTGQFTIPAFTVDGLSTAPINLQVLAAPATQNDNNPELFLQASIEQTSLYVQQLSYYQVTIYFNGDLQRGSLSEPALEGASLVQVGQDSDGSELVNGIRYRTISRRYAIIPQRSGNFTIAPPTFSGEMIDRDSARYNYFARTKTVVQQAQPIDISVQPIPEQFPGTWLIAGLVTLNEEWSPDITQLKQGEPVTRTITLSAVDVADNQLPELQQGFPDGLRLYQEQPQSKSAQRSGRLVAQKVFTTAVIANKAGELELPEVVIPWWNSQTNQLDYARLPARTLTVSAAAGNSPQSADSATRSEQTAASTNAAQTLFTQQAVTAWQWNYLTSLITALWLTTLGVFYLLWQRKVPAKTLNTVASRVKFDHSKLKQACKQNNATAAKAELLRFAHQQLDQRCQSISQFCTLINDASLIAQLHDLNATLYSNNHADWQGQALWQSWQQYHLAKTDKPTSAALTPLYPQ
ncbi:BatD family protein [Rheinheimera maricola]|uniref:BatD family protein n=1 Tax=Rheinheimera maricola TaxID=2793282 RepID=A0ABS7X838_9GAMM|nr:BatD family protein [Rheinheimera maricola]MBZ9611701.1 BatD family protein [Rheinheimera maricola]